MQKIIPFLWFNDQAEAAAKRYTSLFTNSQMGALVRYGENMPGEQGTVMTVAFQLAGQPFMALNGGPVFQFSPAISFFVACQTEEQIQALWDGLSEGGNVLMAFGAYPFSEKFGWLVDAFGVSWQLSLERTPQKISPYLMFVGEQSGRAGEAIQFYTSLFPHSGANLVERYGKDQGEPEGHVMHARFSLAGQQFIAMDSSMGHAFAFTPAISFFVNCETQDEIDHFWDALCQGGHPEQCGWLSDRFGISWQIVPTILAELTGGPDAQRAARVTQAMLKMIKLDIEALQSA